MKKYLGLILLTLTFQIEAKSTGATLMLRAIVPEMYKVEISFKNGKPTAHLTANHHRKDPGFGPRFKVSKLKGKQYLVSVVHP